MMPLNDGFEVTANIAAATSGAIALSGGGTPPTPSTTQAGVTDLAVMTLAELSQYVANVNAQLPLLLADIADLRTKLNS